MMDSAASRDLACLADFAEREIMVATAPIPVGIDRRVRQRGSWQFTKARTSA